MDGNLTVDPRLRTQRDLALAAAKWGPAPRDPSLVGSRAGGLADARDATHIQYFRCILDVWDALQSTSEPAKSGIAKWKFSGF